MVSVHTKTQVSSLWKMLQDCKAHQPKERLAKAKSGPSSKVKAKTKDHLPRSQQTLVVSKQPKTQKKSWTSLRLPQLPRTSLLMTKTEIKSSMSRSFQRGPWQHHTQQHEPDLWIMTWRRLLKAGTTTRKSLKTKRTTIIKSMKRHTMMINSKMLQMNDPKLLPKLSILLSLIKTWKTVINLSKALRSLKSKKVTQVVSKPRMRTTMTILKMLIKKRKSRYQYRS